MTVYTVRKSTQFKRDFKKCLRQGKDPKKFEHIILSLVKQEPLPAKNRDHTLTGNYKGHRECHINPDWLLIYKVHSDTQEIELVRMGSHAELFKM